MTARPKMFQNVAAWVGVCGIAAMGVLSACGGKESGRDQTSTTPGSPTEKSMTNQGPNSFAPTVIGTSPTVGANNNNTVSVPGPPHPPPGGPGGPGAGGPGGPGGGRH